MRRLPYENKMRTKRSKQVTESAVVSVRTKFSCVRKVGDPQLAYKNLVRTKYLHYYEDREEQVLEREIRQVVSAGSVQLVYTNTTASIKHTHTQTSTPKSPPPLLHIRANPQAHARMERSSIAACINSLQTALWQMSLFLLPRRQLGPSSTTMHCLAGLQPGEIAGCWRRVGKRHTVILEILVS